MRILIDTNVLISAMVFGGQSGRLLYELFDSEHELIVTEYIDSEFHDKLIEKWPDKAERVYNLFHQMRFKFLQSTSLTYGELRDKKDIPVLSDAIALKVDVILTGDKDFLESDIEKPIIFSPKMMYEYLHRD